MAKSGLIDFSDEIWSKTSKEAKSLIKSLICKKEKRLNV
jgi:hypothetical protein